MKETITHSAGFAPAPEHVQMLNALHMSNTCNLCGDMDRKNGTLDGYKYCNRYQRYTRPDHVGC